jgi:Flp pilus assembly pilin Flp
MFEGKLVAVRRLRASIARWLGCARALRAFVRGDSGQDLVEYSLLLAFVCLAGAATYIGMAQNVNGIWSIVNSRLAAANQSS